MKKILAARGRAPLASDMTPERRELLRKLIDVRVRERMDGQSKRGGSHAGDVSKLSRARS